MIQRYYRPFDSEVYSTLFITGGLVILVLYVLSAKHATLIPAVTVPVSLISSFIAAYYFGFLYQPDYLDGTDSVYRFGSR